ncbi:hypothetical protein MMC07_003289 [Pseudocyphellaria aurata]|nr:hypothetical protein [Pseudocyphellaria aurata]
MANRDSFDRSSSELVSNLTNVNGSALKEGNALQASNERLNEYHPLVSPDDLSPAVDGVLKSDIAINTLLSRLKQSVASAREFAAFLKKRSTLEEEHAQGLKKLCRSSHEAARRPENRQGSYAQHYNEVIQIHDRMADNGVQFALWLHQMHEDLHDHAANVERGRKHWKQTGLSAEKRVQDAESMMEKAKVKYDSLAEDYDRARTGDKQSSRVFGLKGPKSAAQHEEDLHRKVQAADSDYSTRVQTAQSQRQELLSSLRPQAIKAMQDLINECDAGLTMQLQKFASYNEKLLLANGLCVSPLKGQSDGQSHPSLRDVVYQIDNGRDLHDYLSSFASKVEPKSTDIRYERHPALTPSQQTPTSNNIRMPPTQNFQPSFSSGTQGEIPLGLIPAGPPVPPSQSLMQIPGATTSPPATSGISEGSYGDFPQQQSFSTMGAGIQSQLPSAQVSSSNVYPQASAPAGAFSSDSLSTELPPLKPVFGVSLDDLLKRDGSAIPLVVCQCLQAVDLFGLEVEGIYRLSGSAAHVTKLRTMFDNDPAQVDFRNPEHFFHDVNSVAGLLKQFFRDLPDPLLSHDHYHGFIEAARIDDDITRRDSLHATINSLPDPNYATLRALTLHLNRVQENSGVNRMNSNNLAICFGPTLMGSSAGPDIADAGWQVRVIDTILQNTYQIFDDD